MSDKELLAMLCEHAPDGWEFTRLECVLSPRNAFFGQYGDDMEIRILIDYRTPRYRVAAHYDVLAKSLNENARAVLISVISKMTRSDKRNHQ